MRYSYTSTGAQETIARLDGIAERARRGRPLMQLLLKEVAKVERQQFETAGEHGGRPWPEDKPATVERKRSKGQDTRTLRRTGALWLSLTQPKGLYTIRRANAQSAVFGTRLWYGRFQLPERPLIGVSELDREVLVGRMSDYLLRGEL